ncbi:hypothetical protein CEXT_418891, partial [Caerostris extrusa]
SGCVVENNSLLALGAYQIWATTGALGTVQLSLRKETYVSQKSAVGVGTLLH